MKTTIDIPESLISDAMRFAGVRTKREAVVLALREYNRQQRVAALARHAGVCTDLMTVEELRETRRG